MTEQTSPTPIKFHLSDRAWALSMCLIVGGTATITAYFVANVMKENYMNGLRAGLEISGLMTQVEPRRKIFYDQVLPEQTKIHQTVQPTVQPKVQPTVQPQVQPTNEAARLEN